MPFWSPIIQQVLMIASLFGALFPSTFSFAQPSPTIPTHWATEAITDAQSDFRPFPITRIRLARKEVQAAFESTKKWIHRDSTDGISAEEWRKLLNWSDLEEWLSKKPLPVEDTQFRGPLFRLKKIVAKFHQNKAGFEEEPIVRLRQALKQLGTAMYYSSIPDLQQEYFVRLGQLDAVIGRWEHNHDEASRRAMGDILQWLEDAELGGDLVPLVRSHFAHPNVRITTSAKFLMGQVKINSEVEKEEEVETFIEGYRTKGKVVTRATVKPILTANPNRIDVTLQIEGSAIAENNVGVQENEDGSKGNVTIRSRSESILGGTKVIGIDPYTKPHRQPAKTWAKTTIEVDDIEVEGSTSVLAKLAARARWVKKRPRAEERASEFAADRFKTFIHSMKPIPLPFFTEVFPQFVRTPLDRVGSFPKWIQFSSTEAAALVSMRVAESNRLGSDVPMPEVPAPHDVVFQIHESALNNFSLGTYAEDSGKFSDEITAATIKFLTGRLPPEPLRVFKGVERWSIKTESDPLRITCANGRITFEFRVTEFVRGNRTLKGPITVRGTYNPVIGYFGPKFERDGEAIIEAPAEIGFDDKNFIVEKAEGFFAKTLDLAGLIPPSGGSAEAISRLRLTNIYPADKFLAFGYDEEKTEAASQVVQDEPQAAPFSEGPVIPVPLHSPLPVLEKQFKQQHPGISLAQSTLLSAVRELDGKSITGNFEPRLCENSGNDGERGPVTRVDTKSWSDSGDSLMAHARACVSRWNGSPQIQRLLMAFHENYCLTMNRNSDGSYDCSASFQNRKNTDE